MPTPRREMRPLDSCVSITRPGTLAWMSCTRVMPESLISRPPMTSIVMGTSCANSLFLRAVVVMTMVWADVSAAVEACARAVDGSASSAAPAQVPNTAWTTSAPADRARGSRRRGKVLRCMEVS